MIPILYESNETLFTSNGVCRLRDCLNLRVTESRNDVFELDFDYPVDGANFDQIRCGRIIATYHDDSKTIQPFDIVSYTKPISGIVTFHAVHVSYRQSALTVYGTGINSLADAFTMLGTASPANPFTYTADFTSSAYMAAADGIPRSVRQMLGGIEGSILDAYGGEYEFDKWQVKLHKHRGKARNFTIRYGVNLLDYTDDVDYTTTYTACVPFWKGQNNGTDVVVVGNTVVSPSPSYNGRQNTKPLDLSDKFENMPTTAQLESMAQTLMQSKQTHLPSQTIKIDFVRLQDLGYSEFENLYRCGLCDTINVVFPEYGMNGSFKIVKTVYDALEEKYIEMELGALSTTLAEALGITNTADSINKINDLSVGGDLTVAGNIATAGDITATGSINANNGIVLPNNERISLNNTSNTPREMVYINASNNFILGYDAYNNSEGETRIFGDYLRLYSHNPIVINQPFDGLYKTTTVQVQVATISAHSNISATSHTMTAQSGYNAVGIVGWQTTNFRISPATNYVSSNTSIYAGFKNTSATATTSTTTITFHVLWLKGTSA